MNKCGGSWVLGGNTFFLVKTLKKSGLTNGVIDKIVDKEVEHYKKLRIKYKTLHDSEVIIIEV